MRGASPPSGCVPKQGRFHRDDCCDSFFTWWSGVVNGTCTFLVVPVVLRSYAILNGSSVETFVDRGDFDGGWVMLLFSRTMSIVIEIQNPSKREIVHLLIPRRNAG